MCRLPASAPIASPPRAAPAADGSETLGVTMVIDETAALSPLHLAAQSGSGAEVRRVLRQGNVQVDARARSNGDATPLHVRR